jgi:hypothetical protein
MRPGRYSRDSVRVGRIRGREVAPFVSATPESILAVSSDDTDWAASAPLTPVLDEPRVHVSEGIFLRQRLARPVRGLVWSADTRQFCEKLLAQRGRELLTQRTPDGA